MAKGKKTVGDATHKVLSPLKHNGADYAIGDEIALSDAEAAPLLDVKTVEPLPKAEPVKEPAQ